jgi:hypothetical protein
MLGCFEEEKGAHCALVNGNWIGDVPPELQNLSWTEKMLISRVCHNRCIVRVTSSGMHKLSANAVFFSTPMPKIYTCLPPKREELEEVMAFIYIGPTMPTDKEFKRTPLLVRRNKVAEALEWLKLNHADYADVEISYQNLKEYSEDSPPIVVDFKLSSQEDLHENKESLPVNQNDDDGVDSGECPFIVHGLVGADIENKTAKELRAVALKHLLGGKVLGIGHAAGPESIYDNPQLYPQIFPWLFPYGLGGIGNEHGFKKVCDKERKKSLLMYHDKRFQLEPMFPLVAINHEQIKGSATGGYLLAKKSNFPKIADRLMKLNGSVMSDLLERLSNGESVKPVSDLEKE